MTRTDLIQELEQAAHSFSRVADRLDGYSRDETDAFAARLRARIEHVRKMLGDANARASGGVNGAAWVIFRSFTSACGPLPEGTPEQKGDR